MATRGVWARPLLHQTRGMMQHELRWIFQSSASCFGASTASAVAVAAASEAFPEALRSHAASLKRKTWDLHLRNMVVCFQVFGGVLSKFNDCATGGRACRSYPTCAEVGPQAVPRRHSCVQEPRFQNHFGLHTTVPSRLPLPRTLNTSQNHLQLLAAQQGTGSFSCTMRPHP